MFMSYYAPSFYVLPRHVLQRRTHIVVLSCDIMFPHNVSTSFAIGAVNSGIFMSYNALTYNALSDRSNPRFTTSSHLKWQFQCLISTLDTFYFYQLATNVIVPRKKHTSTSSYNFVLGFVLQQLPCIVVFSCYIMLLVITSYLVSFYSSRRI